MTEPTPEKEQIERDIMSILGYTCETQGPNCQPTTEYVTDRWMKPRRDALVEYVLTIKTQAREQMLNLCLHVNRPVPTADMEASS